MSTLINLCKNVHVSVPVVLALFFTILPIWAPALEKKCTDTYRVLVLYGIAAASLSGPPQKKDLPPSDPGSKTGSL